MEKRCELPWSKAREVESMKWKCICWMKCQIYFFFYRKVKNVWEKGQAVLSVSKFLTVKETGPHAYQQKFNNKEKLEINLWVFFVNLGINTYWMEFFLHYPWLKRDLIAVDMFDKNFTHIGERTASIGEYDTLTLCKFCVQAISFQVISVVTHLVSAEGSLVGEKVSFHGYLLYL